MLVPRTLRVLSLSLLLLAAVGQDHEPPPVPHTALIPKTIVWDQITGFGARYFSIDLPRRSFLDTVVVVDRGQHGGNASEVCRGWSVYMTVNHTVPAAQPRFFERELPELGEVFLAAFVQLQQQSILCRLFSAAKWGVKDAEAGTWWIMVQTRGATDQFDNSTCRFGVWANSHSRAATLWGGGSAIAAFVTWALWTFTLALLPTLQPSFRFYRPSILLHEFLLRLPPDLLYGLLYLVWRVVRLPVAWVQRVRAVVPRNPTGTPAGGGSEDDERTELAILVTEGPTEETPDGDVTETQIRDADPATGTAIPSPLKAQDSAAESSGTGAGAAPDSHTLAVDAAPDPDAAEEDSCRICGDGGAEEPLIEPCACQGSMRAVHHSCLNKWRQESLNNGRPQNAVRCEICNTPFHIVHPPVTCGYILRACAGAVLRLTHHVVAYVAGLYVWSWFIIFTIGHGTCTAPYDAPPAEFGAEQLVFGVIYYGIAAAHLYGCIYWQWLRWLNGLQARNAMAPGLPFATPRNVGLIAYFFFSLFFLELGIGFIVKYLFYIYADSMIWIWDLPLTMGFVLMFVGGMLGSLLLLLREAMGGWAPRLRADLGVVLPRPGR